MSSDMLSIDIVGDQSLLRKLDGLAAETHAKVTKKPLSKSTNIVAKAIRSRVPVDHGALRKSIGRRTLGNRKSMTRTMIVGPRYKWSMVAPDGKRQIPALYAHLVEFGHDIVRRGSMKMKRGKRGGLVKVRGSGQVIGRVKPKPFARPALDASRAQAIRAYINEARIQLKLLAETGGK